MYDHILFALVRTFFYTAHYYPYFIDSFVCFIYYIFFSGYYLNANYNN